MKKHDPEKLLLLFKKSKKVVQAFVDKFQAQHGRKPHGEDLSNAPEYVRVCIKNCKKIKAHMEKIGLSSPDADQEQSPPTKSKPVEQPSKPLEQPLKNIVNNQNSKINPPAPSAPPPTKSKIWGSHLNRSISDVTNNSSPSSKKLKRSKDVQRTVSFSGKLSAFVLEDIVKNTRKSLSIKSSNGKATYFDTMADDNTTLQNLMDATDVTILQPGETPRVDPLFTFHPELSMDGLSQSHKPKIEEKECEIEALTDATNMKIVNESNVKKVSEGKSVSVLSLGGKNATITERNFNELNFSGLFPKRKLDQDGQDQNGEDQESCSKKPRLSYESDEDMFADDNDENNDDPDQEESELLAFDPKDEYNDTEQPKSKRKSVPKKLQGMVSNNFVKIDLKKKNYVRGNKKMTGQQYKRQQYKSKVNSKFGKSR